MRCAHASRGGTSGSCRLTVCVARSFGSSCTREVDASGAVSHDVRSTKSRLMKNRLATGESTSNVTKLFTLLTSRLAVWGLFAVLPSLCRGATPRTSPRVPC